MATVSDAQKSKFVYLISPQALVDDAYYAGSHQHGSVNNSCDCRGFKSAKVMFHLGATDIAVAELSLYESDDNSTFTQVSGSDYNTAGTLPSATADNTAVAWFVDLRKRKRYLRINAKNGNGSVGGYAVAWVELFGAEQVPNSATERGLAQQILI